MEYRERHELEEHHALQEAVLTRDAELAVKLMKAHFEITGEIVLSSGSIS